MKKWVNICFCICVVLLFLSSAVEAQPHIRDARLKPDSIMNVIGVKPGMIIGEAGAGRGYFTFKLSPKVGESGHIYANDIDKKILHVIEKKCKQETITNISTVLGKVDDPLFPCDSLDMIIIINAFHDFEKPVKWLGNVKKYMKYNTPLVMVECDPERWGQGYHHFWTKEKILGYANKADFELAKLETFLEIDNIYIFVEKNVGE